MLQDTLNLSHALAMMQCQKCKKDIAHRIQDLYTWGVFSCAINSNLYQLCHWICKYYYANQTDCDCNERDRIELIGINRILECCK